jgi:hypothetical protein
MVSFSTADNQHRQSFAFTSFDEGNLCRWPTVMKRFSAPFFGVERTLGALVPDQNERRRPLR